MRKSDEATIKNGTPSAVLMERAGETLAKTVSDAMARLGVDDALFVCGGGNNGGDGFVAARILQEAGKEIEVLCLAEKFSEDCKAVKARYRGDCLGRIPRRRYALIVDCIFGTGLSRAPEGDNAALIDFINNSGAYVIACDLPSGLAEGGVALTPCVRADETLTMGLLKQSLLLADGADVAGKIHVAPIGIAPCGRGAEIWEDEDIKQYFPKRRSHTNKGSYGTACLVAGDEFSGAAFLSAGACLKSGAGYTKLFVSEENYPAAIGKLPACILRKFKDTDELLKADCIAIGMGMGVSERLYRFICELLKNYCGTLLLDADALNTLSRYGTEVLNDKTCKVILTPHPGELSRLTGLRSDELVAGGVPLAERIAQRFGVTLVFKNNRTVVTDGARSAIVTAGSAALAKGGSGDVLSGLIAGTVARGADPFGAATVSSYLLGKAGEEAEFQQGAYAPNATDIIGYLPSVMKRYCQ